MAKSSNQKMKILFLLRLFQEAGENTVYSMQNIVDQLAEQGIRAERKSIYDDLEVLRQYGLDIRFRKERPTGYYLAGEGKSFVAAEASRMETPFSAMGDSVGWSEEETQPEDARMLPASEAAVSETEADGSQEMAAVSESEIGGVPQPEVKIVEKLVEKIVKVPEIQIVEKVVEVPVPQIVEKVVEVPVQQVVEKVVEVPVPQIVEKIIEVPVQQVVEKSAEKAASPDEGRTNPSFFGLLEEKGVKKEIKLQCSIKGKNLAVTYLGEEAVVKEKFYGVYNVSGKVIPGPVFYGWLTAVARDVRLIKPKKEAAAYREYLKNIAREYKGIIQ